MTLCVGHADLAGSVKWLTTDCRETLGVRRRGRRRGSRRGGGAAAAVGIEVFGFVRSILDATDAAVTPENWAGLRAYGMGQPTAPTRRRRSVSRRRSGGRRSRRTRSAACARRTSSGVRPVWARAWTGVCGWTRGSAVRCWGSRRSRGWRSGWDSGVPRCPARACMIRSCTTRRGRVAPRWGSCVRATTRAGLRVG